MDQSSNIMRGNGGLKILVVLFNDINIDVRVKNEIDFLVNQGFEVKLIHTGADKGYQEGNALFSFEQFDVSSFYERFHFISQTTLSFFKRRWASRIKTVVKEFSPDIIHVHDLYMLPPTILAKTSVPIVADLHENFPHAFKGYSWIYKFPNSLFVNRSHWDNVEGGLLKRVEGVIGLDNVFLKYLKKKHNLADQFLCEFPNVPDLRSLQSKSTFTDPRLQDDSFKVFYFGMIHKKRGLHIASRAIKSLNLKGRSVKLVLAGSVSKGDAEYFRNSVLGSYVIHIDWIELSQLGSLMKWMDACISPIEKNPQHESGVANKVFQYMFFSKPLLVSNCEPQKNLVESVHCGLSYDHESPEELAEKIIWLMDNPDKAKEMGENGREAILKTYNTNVYGEKIIKLYESVLSKRSAKS